MLSRRRLQLALEHLGREVLFRGYSLASRAGGRVDAGTDARLTVIIPTYASRRARNLAPVVRSLLRCDFVAKVIVSNNNPENQLANRIGVSDPRFTLLVQPERRGPGMAWLLASDEPGDYFMILDDDLLIRPSQAASLLQRLIDAPEVPHGLAGRDGPNYYLSREVEVETLFLTIAATREHVRRYVEYVERMAAEEGVPAETVEFWADDIVASLTGSSRPRVHDVGMVLQCPTHNAPGVAQFQQGEFQDKRRQVRIALARVRAATP